MDDQQRRAIRTEAERIHESAVYSAQGQFEAGKAWRLLHWLMGAVTAGLSTTAAVLTYATDAQTASGVLAILAAISTAVLIASRPDRLSERATARGNDYTALRNDLRRFIHVASPHDSLPALRESLETLAQRASDLDQASDPVPRFAYMKVRRNIAEGGQQFEVDQP